MAEGVEAYHRIGDPEDPFDIEFYQSQRDLAIFRASLELGQRDYKNRTC